MPEKSLAGLNALVTGSGRGIGKEIASALGKKGANFSVHSLHSKDGAFETIDAVLHERVQAIAIQADLSLGLDRARLVEQSVEKLGSIDILVNNASAIIQPAHWEHMSDETWDQTLHVNLQSACQLIKAIAPGMRERAGRYRTYYLGVRNAGCWSSDGLHHRKGRSYESHLFVSEGPRAVRQGERCGTR